MSLGSALLPKVQADRLGYESSASAGLAQLPASDLATALAGIDAGCGADVRGLSRRINGWCLS